jgi:hypothetical protein
MSPTLPAKDIELAAAAADDSVSQSGVSISDDAEVNIKAVSGDEKTDLDEAAAMAALDDIEGKIKAVLGDKKYDVVEASAPAAASTPVTVVSATSAASVASAAVAVPHVVSVQKKG